MNNNTLSLILDVTVLLMVMVYSGLCGALYATLEIDRAAEKAAEAKRKKAASDGAAQPDAQIKKAN